VDNIEIWILSNQTMLRVLDCVMVSFLIETELEDPEIGNCQLISLVFLSDDKS
jgi:hypothetical protein